MRYTQSLRDQLLDAHIEETEYAGTDAESDAIETAIRQLPVGTDFTTALADVDELAFEKIASRQSNHAITVWNSIAFFGFDNVDGDWHTA
jgi:cell fate (sporulation/competence/biofilm development) regulator YmcA (YheA/YmcA/DUF963 family)